MSEFNVNQMNFCEQVRTCFGGEKKDIRTYSPLALAYIGDGVYELIVRNMILQDANRSANQLHRAAVKYVKAPAQAAMMDGLLPLLSEEEESVYRRGRNANPHTVAKNASRTDYRKATGFESLIGFLYMTEQFDRMFLLVKTGMEFLGKDN